MLQYYKYFYNKNIQNVEKTEQNVFRFDFPGKTEKQCLNSDYELLFCKNFTKIVLFPHFFNIIFSEISDITKEIFTVVNKAEE